MVNWMDGVPRIHPETGVQRVGGRLMAAGPDDHLHTFETDSGEISEVGERIVELSDGMRTLGQIVTQLCSEFEVDRARCESDAARFVELLVERKVLVVGPG
jgi:hypothetical protein